METQNTFAWWLLMLFWDTALEKLHITIKKPIVFVAE